ncbi:MAG: efflux RND transporter periplasmic adaptor subunit, partial [Burkholderiaceae bacterium]|nr:efflux RND transporter periplasmic adaptor subunit [Burkholderiaceae bacterium]
MNPRIRIVVALIWLTLLTGCNKPADPPRPAMPGATVDADSITFPKDSPQLATLRTTGVVPERESRVRINGRTAWDETLTTRVTSPLAGRVFSVSVLAGANVRRGQTLAVVSSPEFGQSQADARRAETELRFAERNLARARELHEAGVIPLKDLQSSENDLARARTERERTVAKERLYGGSGVIDQQYRLVAPIDGVVVQRQV